MEEKGVNIYLSDQEASFFIAMREAKVFELRNIDFIGHINLDGVLTDIKRPVVKEKNSFVFIYKRRKGLTKI